MGSNNSTKSSLQINHCKGAQKNTFKSRCCVRVCVSGWSGEMMGVCTFADGEETRGSWRLHQGGSCSQRTHTHTRARAPHHHNPFAQQSMTAERCVCVGVSCGLFTAYRYRFYFHLNLFGKTSSLCISTPEAVSQPRRVWCLKFACVL